ncbi:hypothetical protein [Paenibacillus sp. 481]|uniref:hypothetical protein n=1 Tax=Paenibacillus sp. 481 TaxID=2835869 RepID=UPI001E294776|nr:hypothetical protein [Paenibacillus sp. 481]UHA75139.1 hypothetical protein KIK04_09000 [Paenibacillus sp. 481]
MFSKMGEKQLENESAVESKTPTIGYDGHSGIIIDIIDGTHDKPGSQKRYGREILRSYKQGN